MIGPTWIRKLRKSIPAALPIMMLGGSPTRVAVPPIFESMASAIRKGMGLSNSMRAINTVSGAKINTVVTLSSTMLMMLTASDR